MTPELWGLPVSDWIVLGLVCLAAGGATYWLVWHVARVCRAGDAWVEQQNRWMDRNR